MSIEVFDCEQGSEEWFRVRMGIPTASEFSTVLAKGQGKTRATYMKKLAGEVITGEPMERYSNQFLERGKAMEDEARTHYAFMHDADLKRVGFIRNGQMGCSPDSLIDPSGGLEIKTHAAHLMIDFLIKGECPPEHVPQLQGFLLVTERDWIDLCCYWPKMPKLVVRVKPDKAYLANLRGEIDRFNDELAAIVIKIRLMGDAA